MVEEEKKTELEMYSTVCKLEYDAAAQELDKNLKAIKSFRARGKPLMNCTGQLKSGYVTVKTKTAKHRAVKSGKGKKNAKWEYTYSTDRFDYTVGKQWKCELHSDQPNHIPFTSFEKLDERLLNAFKCYFVHKTLPAGPDCGFLELWCLLSEDKE